MMPMNGIVAQSVVVVSYAVAFTWLQILYTAFPLVAAVFASISYAAATDTFNALTLIPWVAYISTHNDVGYIAVILAFFVSAFLPTVHPLEDVTIHLAALTGAPPFVIILGTMIRVLVAFVMNGERWRERGLLVPTLACALACALISDYVKTPFQSDTPNRTWIIQCWTACAATQAVTVPWFGETAQEMGVPFTSACGLLCYT